MGLQLTKFIPDHEHIFGLTSDCKIGVSQINVACFPHGFLQVPNRGMDGEQGLGVVLEFFGLSEEEEMKLYSKYPAKILWSSSLDMWLHCVPWFVGKGRPLKSNYNAEHGHAETIMHELGVQWALMLGAGTGSSSSNAVLVNIWLDSGASCHVVGNEEILSNLLDPPAGGRPLRVADGFEHKVESIGTIDIPGFRIPNVRFIRRFENLISVGQLAEDHKIRTYLDEVCCILWVGQELTLVGEGIKDKRNGLYRLTFLVVP